jgi:cell division protein FtsB
MKRNDKKILGNSYLANASTSPLKNSDKPEIEQLTLKISTLTKENEKLKEENTKLKVESKKYFNPKNLEEKFNSLLGENRDLKESFAKLKQEFINNNLENISSSNNIAKRDFSCVENKIIDAFNFMEYVSKFFKAEIELYSQKLTQKQKDYDELYMKYVSETRKIYKCSEENEKLKNENNVLKQEMKNSNPKTTFIDN